MLSSTEMYKKHEKLIMKMAWKYLFQTRLEYDDLCSEFKMVFCEVYRSYDHNRGAFSTILSSSIHNRATNLIIKNTALKRRNEVKLDNDLIPEQSVDFEEYSYSLREELGKNEEEVVRVAAGIVFNIPYTPKQGLSPKKWLRNMLKKFGFDDQVITSGFCIIKGMI